MIDNKYSLCKHIVVLTYIFFTYIKKSGIPLKTGKENINKKCHSHVTNALKGIGQA